MRRHLAYCREQQREKDLERNARLRAAQSTGPGEFLRDDAPSRVSDIAHTFLGPAFTMRMLSST